MIVIGNGHETATKQHALQSDFTNCLWFTIEHTNDGDRKEQDNPDVYQWIHSLDPTRVFFLAGFSMVRIKQDSPVYLCTNFEDWFLKDDLPTNKPYRPWIPNMTVWKCSNVLLEVKFLSIISPAVFKRKL